ncbi:VOC family protein [Paenarthrobacter sp. Z7-10]|uniref:VOC family protein n=1 Tax=Paenarthrobacter sp. Z7-10 TaxID=2787635 RepID=UPI0022A94378|nr:VOC family protein [Paenarthrobacter sp. Z7-10]MCZ2404048.1 VOC family protein [Paenarthrobacter sp. Z7-10]
MATHVDYFEVGSPDPEVSKAFYGQLFDWEVGPPSPGAYSTVNGTAGGLWDTSAVGGGNWAIFYVHVDDVAEAVRKAESLGATVALPLTTNPAIEFAHLIDPHGNRFGVWRPRDQAEGQPS